MTWIDCGICSIGVAVFVELVAVNARYPWTGPAVVRDSWWLLLCSDPAVTAAAGLISCRLDEKRILGFDATGPGRTTTMVGNVRAAVCAQAFEGTTASAPQSTNMLALTRG